MTNTAPSFHIAFSIDDRYCRSMGATILSVIDNNPGVHFTFHVITSSMADEHRARLAQLEKNHAVKTHIHIVSTDLVSQFAHHLESTPYPPATFNRIAIPDMIREYTDKVLYLDADILCVGKIDELMTLPMNQQIVYVAPDAQETTTRRVAALKLNEATYFNSGVIYINIPQWHAHHIAENAAQALLSDRKDLRFLDQDALNIALNGKATYIGRRWNYLYDLIHDLEKDKRTLRDVGDAVFIHFAGAVKPWANWSLHDARDLFAKYHAMSPWSDMPMDCAPRTYKEMRMHSRFLWKRGQYVESMKWYGRYLRARA